MRLTERDVAVLKDVALSHVLSRDQIIECGYFTSVTRANTRLREMSEIGLMRRLETPFFSQSLYGVAGKAGELLGPRIGAIVSARASSPRFLQHALMVTNVRLALARRGSKGWRFEQQLRTLFTADDQEFEVRPDGLAQLPSGATAVEVDLGHVAPSKFAAKLRSYQVFAKSQELKAQWNLDALRILTLTTGKARAKQLIDLLPDEPHFDFLCVPFDELGVRIVGAWS